MLHNEKKRETIVGRDNSVVNSKRKCVEASSHSGGKRNFNSRIMPNSKTVADESLWVRALVKLLLV